MEKKNIAIRIVPKFILAILLIGCFLKVPYAYFQIIRWVGCIGFYWIASAHTNKAVKGLWLALLVLLNPIFPIHFTRTVWNGIDGVIAAVLLIWGIVEVIKYRKNGEYAFD